MKGLSQDLYALADGRQGIVMPPEDRQRWAREADAVLSSLFLGQVDLAFQFLRQPFPADLPQYAIPFLQARCWERLGENEVALVFMREAERLDPRQAACALNILERLGRTEEAAECADRIIANPNSSGEELYQAAGTLLQTTHQMEAADARPGLERLVPILVRALRVFLTTARGQRDIPDADRCIITMLGFCHERLGNVRTAIQLYKDGLARYPNDVDLLMFRGFALIDTDLPRALGDFRRAVQLGSLSRWPYYFLAWDALQRGNYEEVRQLCSRAIERPGGTNHETAQLYEWLGIARTESGQAMERVLQNFDQAESLDPGNERIRHNRSVAEARRGSAASPAGNGWVIDGRASTEQALREAYSEVRPGPDRFVEQRSDTSLATLLKPA